MFAGRWQKLLPAQSGTKIVVEVLTTVVLPESLRTSVGQPRPVLGRSEKLFLPSTEHNHRGWKDIAQLIGIDRPINRVEL